MPLHMCIYIYIHTYIHTCIYVYIYVSLHINNFILLYISQQWGKLLRRQSKSSLDARTRQMMEKKCKSRGSKKPAVAQTKLYFYITLYLAAMGKIATKAK